LKIKAFTLALFLW